MRVLLADADQQLRWALRSALEEQPGLVVIGEADRDKELLDQARALSPDLVLVDWELPGRPATVLLTDLRLTSKHSRVIILSDDPGCIPKTKLVNGHACLSKAVPPDRFLAALRGLLAEEQSIFQKQRGER